jgi:hypothetical protein
MRASSCPSQPIPNMRASSIATANAKSFRCQKVEVQFVSLQQIKYEV